jgi:hypothetical protein
MYNKKEIATYSSIDPNFLGSMALLFLSPLREFRNSFRAKPLS